MNIKTKEPTQSIIVVTPAMAEAWLKFNTNNRKMKPLNVKLYAEHMVNGTWKFNGADIKFDTDGHVLDGQNRLQAIVESGCSVLTAITTGLQPEVFDTIDIGKPRSSPDALHRAGVRDSRRAAAALAIVSMYDRGVKSGIRDRIRTEHTIAKLAEYPDIPTSLAEMANNNTKLIPGSIFDGYYYIFRRIDKPLAVRYMLAMRDGTGVEEWRAWHSLRERLIRNMGDVHKFSEIHVAALLLKGWNYARGKRDYARVVWVPDNEPFPMAI